MHEGGHFWVSPSMHQATSVAFRSRGGEERPNMRRSGFWVWGGELWPFPPQESRVMGYVGVGNQAPHQKWVGTQLQGQTTSGTTPSPPPLNSPS